MRHRRPFNVIEAARAGVATVTAEDAILSKLDWARQAGDSERQIRDAAGIVELNPTLDWAYIRRWAAELSVAAAPLAATRSGSAGSTAATIR